MSPAIEAMRQLWQGGVQTFTGKHYRVDHARIYDLPEQPVELVVAAANPKAAALAGRLGDGLVSTSPDEALVEEYRRAGGDGPVYGQVTACWAESEEEAVRTALEIWPNAGIPGRSGQELPMPADYEALAKLVTEGVIAEQIVCGPNANRYVEEIRTFVEAGYSHVYLHQVGRDQAGFFSFFEDELEPRLAVVESRA